MAYAQGELPPAVRLAYRSLVELNFTLFLQDDAASLDVLTMHRWNLILRVFTMEYLGLTLPDATTQKGTRDELVSRVLPLLGSQRVAETSFAPAPECFPVDEP